MNGTGRLTAAGRFTGGWSLGAAVLRSMGTRSGVTYVTCGPAPKKAKYTPTPTPTIATTASPANHLRMPNIAS